MKLKNTEINLNKGFYRIFIILSFLSGFAAIIYAMGEFDKIYGAVLFGLIAGIGVYLSFFVLEWIVLGFMNSENYDKNFFRIIIEKISKINLAIPFMFILMLFSILLLGSWLQINSLHNKLNVNNDIIKAKNAEIEAMSNLLQNCQSSYWNQFEVVNE